MTTLQSERFPDWETLYRQQPGETLPWYYADLDPDLAAALRDHGLTRGRLLDLGTGPGTQAIALAARGFETTGTDLSATAVAKATALAQARGFQVTFVQDDVLASRLTASFDAVFDRGCFHVIDPSQRGTYVDATAGWLAPGGLLLLKTFSKLQPDDVGPHRFSPDEIRTTFAPRFELLSATETVYQGTLDPLPKALFSVLRRL
ncbi:SAM-dependent methyltransferase [Nannocystis punicea]|uniref:Class I SAM-dependent methyltransferase n=1 Tax=Nannocystis punicea TaxID=2995304 RepID=A0ABY7GW81_9BACT|nr:class I SAM-dependent methyltransferase [Nannocystis poenicansa]WAS91165.1 class I SAM-dependent methyltransferase [Nannocystis poenicansa]